MRVSDNTAAGRSALLFITNYTSVAAGLCFTRIFISLHVTFFISSKLPNGSRCCHEMRIRLSVRVVAIITARFYFAKLWPWNMKRWEGEKKIGFIYVTE